jgi:hypothetical protein
MEENRLLSLFHSLTGRDKFQHPLQRPVLSRSRASNSSVTITSGDKVADMTAQWNLALLGASFTVDLMYLELLPTPDA